MALHVEQLYLEGAALGYGISNSKVDILVVIRGIVGAGVRKGQEVIYIVYNTGVVAKTNERGVVELAGFVTCNIGLDEHKAGK